MKLFGALLLLLLFPAYSYGDYCAERCQKGRDIYKHGRNKFTIVCGEFFKERPDLYKEPMEWSKNCIKWLSEKYECYKYDKYDYDDRRDQYPYTVLGAESFECKALPAAVKLDCHKACEDQRWGKALQFRWDPFSFPCIKLDREVVDCTKCTEECPTDKGEGQYECLFEIDRHDYPKKKHMIHCPRQTKPTHKPVTATTTTAAPVGEPMTTPAPTTTGKVTTTPVVSEVTTTSGSPQVAEQKTEGDDDDNSTVYIIVGVVVGLLLLIVAGGIAYYFYRKWKMRRQVGEAQPASEAVEPSVDESVSSVSSYSGQRPVKAIGKV